MLALGGRSLDVHAMAPGVVQLGQLDEIEHLNNAADRKCHEHH